MLSQNTLFDVQSLRGFPCGSAGKESACNAGDLSSIPGLGRSSGEGKVYPLQYSGLENSMDCMVCGVTNSWTRLSDFTQLLSRVRLCDSMGCSTPGSPVLHYLLEFAQFMSIESLRLSKHLILCGPLLLLPSIFPSIRWPKYWSFSFSICPSNEYLGLISFRTD